jgi:hypothetical protein
MDITDIYEAASARGLARSLRHFSSDPPGLGAQLRRRHGAGPVQADALLRLYHRLGELRQPTPGAGVRLPARRGRA